ncbi:MAG: ATP synthase F1 subunit epsilon [Candidatus Obscuribacterales bacterium]|nr:ATP synthase F1 subunit epsilon [Candidatus Obscuribacterales bacterium]
MTAGTLNLKIITPDRIVFEAPVKQVTARAVDGELTILPEHEPLVTALAIDIVEFKGESSFDTAAVIGGVMEVQDNNVTIVSNVAELDTEIDEARANQAKARLEAERTQKTDKIDVQVAEMALSRAMARLKAVELTKRRKGGHNR